jgi:hypothetical protein
MTSNSEVVPGRVTGQSQQFHLGLSPFGNHCLSRDKYLNSPCLLVHNTQISQFPGQAFLLTFINFHF